MYATLLAVGGGAGYMMARHEQEEGYQVVEQCGNMYVQENRTGLLARVDDEFDIRPVPGDAGPEACRRTRSFSERVEDAYQALTE